MLDCGDARAIAQMATNQPKGLHRPTQKLGRFSTHEGMRRSVKPVAPDSVLFGKFGVDCVCSGPTRQSVVKGCVKHGDMRCVGKGLPRCADTGQIHRIVQRRKGDACFDSRNDVVVNDGRVGEAVTAVDNTVPNRIDGVFIRLVQYLSKSRLMGGLLPYPLDLAAQYRRALLDIDKLIFDTRGPTIDDENVHCHSYLIRTEMRSLHGSAG